MQLGIVGLPNVGKSTLFNALTRSGAASENFPFSTVERNVGVVAVPDSRLDALNAIYKARSVVPANVEFVDIAGLVKGSSGGEGLGNKFLAYIREVDALVHVVRCFDDDDTVHIYGNVDPARDIETIQLELIFSDLELIEKRRAKAAKQPHKSGESQLEYETIEKLIAALESGQCASKADLTKEECAVAAGWGLLSQKPVLYAANCAEGDLKDDGKTNPYVQVVRETAEAEGAGMFTICAKFEEELVDLPDEDKAEFLLELGVEEGGLNRLIRASYHLLGLISFLTAGPKEVRAWTIKAGTKAPGAAGKIHSDLERGFIRAEICSFDDLIKYGSQSAVKEAGLLRSEGREYVISDGDVILFRFNV